MAELASELLSLSLRKDSMMNQANIVPGLSAQALGTQDYLSSAATAPGDQGFEGELTLALGAAPAAPSSAESDSEPAPSTDAGLQNMPVVLPWLPAMAANFSTPPVMDMQVDGAPAGTNNQALAMLAGAQAGQSGPWMGPSALASGAGPSAVPPESGSALTQALQTAPLASSGATGKPTELPAAQIFQAAATAPSGGQPATGLASTGSPGSAATAAAAVHWRAGQAVDAAPAQDFKQAQASSTAADLRAAAPQTAPAQTTAQTTVPTPTGLAQPVAEPAGQAKPLQPSASAANSLGAQLVDRPASSPAHTSPAIEAANTSVGVSTSPSALGSAQNLSQLKAKSVQDEAMSAPVQSAATAKAAAEPVVQQLPGAAGLAQTQHGQTSAPAEPSSARLGIEASAPLEKSAESAELAGLDPQAVLAQSQTVAAPAPGEPASPPRSEPVSWSSSPVTATAGSGAAPSTPAAPALPPSVDMSLPIKPHWVSLESGAVQVEVLRMAREGGGQVTLELTPPDQGRYRLDLRIDDFGRASLVVEGVSESMRTRLEMGESSLRDQFAQMGLQLSLQMRSQQGQADSEGPSPSPQAWAAGSDADSGLAPNISPSRRTVALDLDRSLVRLYA